MISIRSIIRTNHHLIRSGRLGRSALFTGSLTQVFCPSISREYLFKYSSTLISNEDKDSNFESSVPLSHDLEGSRRCYKQGNALASLKIDGSNAKEYINDHRQCYWKLNVGVEIHALLNTERKLFSPAQSTFNQKANTHVALFDVAMPGSQPIFQKETLVPAIRAALVLNCKVQANSRFDRKHYFHWDQPAGYQITQYYQPYAKDGYITLYAHDGIAKEDGDQIRIRIKRIQLEQDTAKTISKSDFHFLDFNRVGLPLIEIITLPEISHPKTAAALVRKIQTLLNSVNACNVGMEAGGLRADINVSVRRADPKNASYEFNDEISLGQKTEIKNLSSFKSIEDAIIAERDRQIRIIEGGGIVTGETRGWTIGANRTIKLRAKEGEIDYRYMPDPDLPPVVISNDVISYLQSTLGISTDEEIDILINKYGLTHKDAITLVSLENGGRVGFFYKVVEMLQSQLPLDGSQKIGKISSNWILHDIASLKHNEADESNPLKMKIDGTCIFSCQEFVNLLYLVQTGKILRKPAKYALRKLFASAIEKKNITLHEIIEKENLWNNEMSNDHYRKEAQIIIDQHENILKAALGGNQHKIKILLGMMMKNDKKGVMDPALAEQVLKSIIDEYREKIS